MEVVCTEPAFVKVNELTIPVAGEKFTVPDAPLPPPPEKVTLGADV
jgi:hypothetical protein